MLKKEPLFGNLRGEEKMYGAEAIHLMRNNP